MKKLLLALMLMPALCFADAQVECVYSCSGLGYMRVYRISIPTGWVVLSHVNNGYATTFVPDKDHAWKVS